MTDERFEEFIREAAPEYRRPPDPPRDAMWSRIEAARAKRRGERELERQTRRWVRWGTGIAALLVLGIGIGRWTANAPAPAPVAAIRAMPESGDEAGDLVYRVAALEYLARTEAFLSVFRTEARSGRADPDVQTWVSDLLTTGRLMMDSPLADDPVLTALLEDLELILVQIADFVGHRDRDELDLIEQGLDERGVMHRLRTMVDTDPRGAPAQGA